MCQRLLTVNLGEKLKSSKCNLSLEPKIMILVHIMVSMVTKGHLESPSVFFWEAPRHKLRKTCVKHSFSNILFIKWEIWA